MRSIQRVGLVLACIASPISQANDDAPSADEIINDILQTFFGDANFDLQVDEADLNILAANFDQPGGWANGDFNGDAFVDLDDLTILGTTFGAGVGVSANAITFEAALAASTLFAPPPAAPEPSAAAAGIGAVWLLFRRRRAPQRPV